MHFKKKNQTKQKNILPFGRDFSSYRDFLYIHLREDCLILPISLSAPLEKKKKNQKNVPANQRNIYSNADFYSALECACGKFLEIECHREIVSFRVTDVFFAARQCSLSVEGCVSPVRSSYTGLS